MQNRSHKHELSSLPLYMVVVAALHTETQSLSLWLNRRWSWCCSEIHWTPVWTDRTIYTDMHNKNNTNFVGQDSSLWNRPEQNKQDKCLGFLFEYIFLNVIYSCDANLNFSIITPVFSVTWSFRNHSNMRICFKKHFLLSVLKTLVLLHIFVETLIHFISGYFMNKHCSFELSFSNRIIYDIINIFTVSLIN